MLSGEEIFEGAKDFSNKLIDVFYKLTNIKVEIEFTDDLYGRNLELAKSYEEKQDIIFNEGFNKSTNATLRFPEYTTDIPHILISKNIITNLKNPNQLVSTIPHELAHVKDFYDFCSFNKIDSLNAAQKCSEFRAFNFWTEYNARREGYDFYRKFLEMDNNSVSAAEGIKNRDYPWHLNELKEDLQIYKGNHKTIIYCLIQFIGHFSVWNDLFPSYFNVNTLPKYLLTMFDSKIINLYNFLYQNKRFDDIKYRFIELDDLLSRLVE